MLIKVALEATGKTIGGIHAAIAPHKVVCQAVLVTNNVRHFARIPGLRIADQIAD